MDDETIERQVKEQAEISREASKLLAKICALFVGYGEVTITATISTDCFEILLTTEKVDLEPGPDDIQVFRNLVSSDGTVVSVPSSPTDETIN